MISTFFLAAAIAQSAQPFAATEAQRTIEYLGRFVGGTWETHADGKLFATGKATWIVPGKAMKWEGKIYVGQPNEVVDIGWMGIDEVTNEVYYINPHGGTGEYRGTIALREGKLRYTFHDAVTKHHFEAEEWIDDKDQLHFRVKMTGADTWLHESTWKRVAK